MKTEPIVPPLPECSDEGELLPHFNNTSDGQLSRYEGTFEICVGGFYGSVCDIGWNQIAAHALCYSQFGSGYGKCIIPYFHGKFHDDFVIFILHATQWPSRSTV